MITESQGSGKVIFITTHILGEMDEAIGKNYNSSRITWKHSATPRLSST
jgi:hypothetical protein